MSSSVRIADIQVDQSERPLLERGRRYIVVGAICAIAHNVIMITVDQLGRHYLLGIMISFLAVTPTGYALHSWFTFGKPLRFKAFARFAAGVAAAYPISVAMMVLLCSWLGLGVAIASPIATVALLIWNVVVAHLAILSRFSLRSATAPTASRSTTRQFSGNEE
ncbi:MULTISPECIES: GtrA family protein [unclassified Mesorhizobium]|uniref:GtrA family protein n=1 Tax=unclassified Mesorhizobium TaxID=325217 RepID=UPI0004CEAF90|nr:MULTISPECIES: GtrA family protein [unclassified Mesorhizobium]WJI73650.1 GtrA family protein [Mesorhizobium sp. C395A]